MAFRNSSLKATKEFRFFEHELPVLLTNKCPGRSIASPQPSFSRLLWFSNNCNLKIQHTWKWKNILIWRFCSGDHSWYIYIYFYPDVLIRLNKKLGLLCWTQFSAIVLLKTFFFFLDQNPVAISCKGPIVNILGFAGHMVSIATTFICYRSTKHR